MVFLERIYCIVQDFLSFCTGGTECICCGKSTLALPLCKKCAQKMFDFVPFGQNSRCERCGKVLVSEEGICTECNLLADSEKGYVKIFPIHMYRLWKKDLMFAWKGLDQRRLSLFFAELMNAALVQLKKKNLVKFDAIVPVPVRPGKLKVKGWDQVEELCTILSKKYSYPVWRLLERTTVTEQKSLTREQRKGSEGALYRLKDKICLKGKRLLIIDDVVTTGSTVKKCAAVLKKAGAEEVMATSLFRVN